MRIVCLIGKSGSGKSSIEAGLEKLGYNRIISYTTREPRGSEKNGVEYNFVTKEGFLSLIDKDILMEHAEYNGNYYGAPKPVGSINNVIVVETQGFKRIKELYGKQAIGVYINTPSDILESRVKGRNDTSDTEISSRKETDKKVFHDAENLVDLVIDGTQPIDKSIIDILEFISRM